MFGKKKITRQLTIALQLVTVKPESEKLTQYFDARGAILSYLNLFYLILLLSYPNLSYLRVLGNHKEKQK